MKQSKVFVFLFSVIGCILFATPQILAQSTTPDVPRLISYQGMLTVNGQPVADGPHLISLRLYADAGGTTPAVWIDTFNIVTQSGVFSVMLGSHESLPSSPIMSQPLWLGVAIDGGEELPLSQLSASPYALSVPNGSITAEKMGTNYLSSLSINGQQVTGKGSNINFVAGPGLALLYDPSTNSVLLSSSNSAGILGKGMQTLSSYNYIMNQTSQESGASFNISGSGTIGTDLSVAGTSALQGAVTLGTGSGTTAGQLIFNDGHSSDSYAATVAGASQYAANRTYTLPDVSANANFVMSEGAQTINGNKSFGNKVSVTDTLTTSTIVTTQGILPSRDTVISLGDSTHRFKDLYLSGHSLVMGTGGIQTEFTTDSTGGLVITNTTDTSTASTTIAPTGAMTTSGSITSGDSITANGPITTSGTITAGDSITAAGPITTTSTISSGDSITAAGPIATGNSIVIDGHSTPRKIWGDLTTVFSTSSGDILIDPAGNLGVGITYPNNPDALLEVSGSFHVTGNSTLGGTLNLTNHQINSIADPSSAQDAATKHYVDNAITTTENADAVTDSTALLVETNRAESAESALTTNLSNEVTRAEDSEASLRNNLASEVTRAESAEGTLTTNLSNETTRAEDSESSLRNNLANEVSRAEAAEGTLTSNLNGEISTRTSQAATYLLLDGTRSMSGNLNLNSHAMTNVTDPSNAQDAATKHFVDTAIASATGNNYIANGISPQASANFDITGNGTLGGTLAAAAVTSTGAGTFGGLTVNGSSTTRALTVSNANFTVTNGTTHINVADGTNDATQINTTSGTGVVNIGNPTTASMSLTSAATTINTVGTGTTMIGNAIGGVTLSSALNLGSHAINNVTDPTNAQDAATKHYVDNATVANASTLEGRTWEAPGTIGSTTANSGNFTTLTASGAVNINQSSNAPTNLSGGTGSTSIGNPTGTTQIVGSAWNINIAGAATFGASANSHAIRFVSNGISQVFETDVVGSSMPLEILSTPTTSAYGGGTTFGRAIRIENKLDNTTDRFYDQGIDQSGNFFITEQNTTAQGLTLSPSGNLTIPGTATLTGLHLNGAGNATSTTSGIVFDVENTGANGTGLQAGAAGSGNAFASGNSGNGFAIFATNTGTGGVISANATSGDAIDANVNGGTGTGLNVSTAGSGDAIVATASGTGNAITAHGSLNMSGNTIANVSHINNGGGGTIAIDGNTDFNNHNLSNLGYVTLNSTSTLSAVSGTVNFASDIDVRNHSIYNVNDPASAQDAATKNYVDNHTVNAQHGGTGINTSSTGTGSLLYTSSTGTWSTLSPGNQYKVLTSNGTSSAPSWGTPPGTAVAWGVLDANHSGGAAIIDGGFNVGSVTTGGGPFYSIAVTNSSSYSHYMVMVSWYGGVGSNLGSVSGNLAGWWDGTYIDIADYVAGGGGTELTPASYISFVLYGY